MSKGAENSRSDECEVEKFLMKGIHNFSYLIEMVHGFQNSELINN